MRVVARRREATGFTHDVEIDSGHTIVIDEPVEHGGGDLGPSPTRAAAAGLAACTAITCEMYAARKGWTVREAERWLAPVLNYIPSQQAAAPVAEIVPANDVTSHPPGCTCAVHLAWRKKAVGA